MLKKEKRNFKENTKSLFLKYTIIPILILIILFSFFTIVIFKLKMIHDVGQSAKNIEKEMTEVYKEYSDEIMRMSNLPVVIHNVETHRQNHLVYEEFYNFNNQQDVKSAFYLIDKENIFVTSTTESSSEINKDILNDIIPRIKKNPNDVLLDVNETRFSHGKTSFITFGKAILKDEQIIGFLVYKLFEEDLQRLIFGEKADIVVVTDKYDHVIVTTNSIVKGLMNKFNPESISKSHVKIKNESYYMKQIHTSNDLFTIYTLKNTKGDYIVLFLYIAFILITCGFLYFLVNVLAEKMSTKNVKSIDKLLEAVSRLEKGDMKSYVNIKTGDEFELLANQYNIMLDNLNDLMKKNKELSDIQKMNEIKLLQSQFNPHFLFNVLETLRYTMLTNVERSQEIILALSGLLRYSINDKIKKSLFEKDMNYIVDYLKLHKLRFNDRLHYDIEVSEKVKNTFVPKLLLQPIIENAIKYGYQTQTSLNIIIRGEIVDNYILFKVIDDGNGMEENKLHEIRSNLGSSKNEEIGIGLYNIHRRLVLQYGEGFGLSIFSTPGKGTKVEIKLPYEKGEDTNV